MANPMRILMVSDVFFPRVNGVSTSILSFANEFERQGHSVTLIAPDYGSEYSTDINLLRVPSKKVFIDPEDRMLKMRWVMERIDLLAKCEFDLVHIQTPFLAHYLGLKLSRTLNLPVLETYHTFFEEYLYNYIPIMPKSILRLLARRFSTSQCNRVNHVVVPSAPIEQSLRRYGVKTPVTIVPTGLELEKFSSGNGQSFRDVHGLDQNRPIALYVGRIAHEKNIRFLLRAMKKAIEKMPEILFVMAGEGPAERWAWRWVEHEGLNENVVFLGYMDRATTLLDCYRAADLFVFSSRTETQGLVLLESMAMGTPVVSTAVLGTQTVLSNGRGVLIAQEDEDDFSSKVVQVLRDHEYRRALSDSALEYAREWSIVKMAERKIAVYQALIEPRYKSTPTSAKSISKP